jgi:hypothetical protein
VGSGRCVAVRLVSLRLPRTCLAQVKLRRLDPQ